MQFNLKVFHKGLILVGLPVLLNCAIVGALFYLILQADHERLEESRQAKINQNSIRLGMLLFRTAFKAERFAHEFNFDSLHQIRDDMADFFRTRKELLALMAQEKDELLRTKFREGVEISNPLMGYAPMLRNFYTTGSTKIKPSREELRKARSLLDKMSENYQVVSKVVQKHLEESPQKQAFIRQLQFLVLFGGMVLNIALAFLLAKFFINGIVSRLRVMTDNSKKLANEEALNQPLKGSDEIALLDQSFHRMADALIWSAQKERAAFDNASDIICVLDEQGRFTRINPACQKLWFRLPATLIGMKLTEITLPEDQERTEQAIAKVKEDEPAAEFENQIYDGKGNPLSLLWSIYWSEPEQALFCVAHDISERRKLEAMKRRFLEFIGHDLRQPLTSLYQIFQRLVAQSYGPLPEAATNRLNQTVNSIKRLETLVGDLINIEKLESSNLEIQKEIVSIKNLLDQSVQEVEQIANQKQIEIIVDCRVEHFILDQNRMTQVLINLLSNALKFSPAGSSITVSSLINADRLEISVRDRGRGIPESKLAAIFERFEQVEALDGTRGKGTGLGLPICKQIVQSHNGTIKVTSKENEGSTFIISIPRNEVQHTQTTLESKEKVPTTISKPSPKKRTTSGLSLKNKGLILVGVPVVIGLIFASIMSLILIQADQETAKQRHNRAIILNAGKLTLVAYAMVGELQDKPTPAQWEELNQRVKARMKDAEDILSKLRDLIANDPHLLKDVLNSGDGISQLRAIVIDSADNIIKMHGCNETTLSEIFDGNTRNRIKPIVADIYDSLDALASTATQMDSLLPERIASLRRNQSELLILALIFSVLASLALAIYFTKNITGRLKTLQDNSRRLASGQELKAPMNGADEIAQLDHVFHDMAESLNEARRKENAVFDNSQDVICTLSPDSIFLQINPACKRLWGYSNADLLGLSLSNIVLADDLERTVQTIFKCRNENEPQTFENRILRKDGSTSDMLWSISWSEIEQALFAVAHDISKRKELERIKQEVLAMVSHDLRTPITVIQGVAKLMTIGAFGELPAAAKQELISVNDNSSDLLNLINNLLDLEKLESGQMTFVKEELAAGALFEEVNEAIKASAAKKEIKLVIRPSDAVIQADPERIKQVIINLLTNAITASSNKSNIELSATTDQVFLKVQIIDQGKGIDQSAKAELFERYKTSAPHNKVRSGPGLGLPICKYIVEAHGGNIGFESSKNGSVFWFTLPLANEIKN
ncbi:MAG: PAS domain S-box protein [Candidatus Obscuribacterales bacterium]|nr:PAS domain S-box protein [Candidatus Obscuribacterales bacterium]